MKKLIVTTVIFVFLLFLSNGIQAQTTQTQLNQLELMKQFLGTWQGNAGKDTVEVWDCHQYGKAFIINVSNVIKGQKTPLYVNNVGFDTRDGKIKGYALWPNGDYTTWIAVFNPEKKFSGDLLDSFTPGSTWGKFEMVIVNPKEWTWRYFNSNGVKTSEIQFAKVK
jgi:hypothetical protein